MSNLESGGGQPKYRRIVLKLSGEALREPGSHEAISPGIVTDIAKQILQVQKLGVEIAVVIGGGNIWRGLTASHRGMDRTTADYMGMLATVINGMALQSALEQIGIVKSGEWSFSVRARAIHFSRPTRPPLCARARSGPR